MRVENYSFFFQFSFSSSGNFFWPYFSTCRPRAGGTWTSCGCSALTRSVDQLVKDAVRMPPATGGWLAQRDAAQVCK